MTSSTVLPGSRRNRAVRGVLGLMLLTGILSLGPIFYFQRRACGLEYWPAAISPAIAYGLVLSGVLGLANGLLISTRQPGNRIGWLCMVTGSVGLVTTLANRYALCGLYGPEQLPGLEWAAWLSYVLAPVIIALVFWQIPIWFPFGEYLSPAWGRYARLSWTGLLIGLALIGILPGELRDDGVTLMYPVTNPLGVNQLAGFGLERLLPRLVVILLIVTSIAANLSLVLRWRSAKGDERQQIKWIAYFVGIVVSLFLVVEIVGQAFMPGLFGSPIYVIGFYLAWIGYPVVIGISVLKYRLYDIDIVIRRTLSYTAVSLSLGLIYLVSVSVLQLVFSGVSRQQSHAAIVISTLLIAALFNPLRRSIQEAIDRRFYRSKYDAARTLEAFSATVRNEVGLEAMLGQLESVVDQTLQPETVSIWLARRGS